MVRPDVRAASAMAPAMRRKRSTGADVHGGGDDRPPRLGEDRLEQRRQQRRIVVDHAGGVDRIGRRSPNSGRIARSFSLVAASSVASVMPAASRQSAATAAEPPLPDTSTTSSPSVRSNGAFASSSIGLDELIVAVGLHDAAAAQERAQDLGVAGERAGVRADHRLAGRRGADLEEHQRFLQRMRPARRAHRACRDSSAPRSRRRSPSPSGSSTSAST